MKRAKLTQNDIQFILIAILVLFSGIAMLFFGIKRDRFSDSGDDGTGSYPNAAMTPTPYLSLNAFLHKLDEAMVDCSFRRVSGADNEFEYAVSFGDIFDYGKLILSTDSYGQIKRAELQLEFFYYDAATADEEIIRLINEKCKKRMNENLKVISSFFYCSMSTFDTENALSNADKSILMEKLTKSCKDRESFSKKSSGVSVGLYTVDSTALGSTLGIVIGIS